MTNAKKYNIKGYWENTHNDIEHVIPNMIEFTIEIKIIYHNIIICPKQILDRFFNLTFLELKIRLYGQ